MCGIWGIVTSITQSELDIGKTAKKLFVLSEKRGKEASGVALYAQGKVHVCKGNLLGTQLIHTEEYRDCMKHVYHADDELIAIIGHSRMTTNGTEYNQKNNQPVCSHANVCVHNGIIVNDEALWNAHTDLMRESTVDTEIFLKLLEKKIAEKRSVLEGYRALYSEIDGMASTLCMFPGYDILVACSNNGSLYYVFDEKTKCCIFASERLILQELLSDLNLQTLFDQSRIKQVRDGHVWVYDLKKKQLLSDGELEKYELHEGLVKRDIILKCHESLPKRIYIRNDDVKTIVSKYAIDKEKIGKLKRCTKCVLPETMPFIKFDEKGVCNYCRTYQKQQYFGKDKLYEAVSKMKKSKDGIDSIVAFSGGRDSSYGLHYFVKELGLNPVAYAYDWGMLTDLARRNQSRMCARLGVEFVLVSANIQKKRANIRRNVTAWMKHPSLGMIPLFMAGDKHYFYYANKVRKDFGVDTVLLAANPFEKTHFKSGYCGVMPEVLKRGSDAHNLEGLPMKSVLMMSGYYLGQFLRNPAYVNKSLVDTATAAASYYVIPHNYFRLFDYIPWNEDEVNKLLLEEYDWEIATDTKSTWRIGDGTAAFYNYIYYLVSGFTENDTLRSNQVREGMITREEALCLVEQDNAPRYETMQWYFDVINVSMKDAIAAVHNMEKLY